MRHALLEADGKGHLHRVVEGVLGAIGIALSAWCLFVVREALPEGADGARHALTLLFIGAMIGLPTCMTMWLKVWQGRRVILRTSGD